MRPILFTLPGMGLRIHSYGVMIFVACSAALAMAVWRARREKVDPNAVYELATWLFLGGVIGAGASTSSSIRKRSIIRATSSGHGREGMSSTDASSEG